METKWWKIYVHIYTYACMYVCLMLRVASTRKIKASRLELGVDEIGHSIVETSASKKKFGGHAVSGGERQ